MVPTTPKQVPLGFKQSLVRQFLRNASSLDQLLMTVQGFERQQNVVITEEFYWLDPELEASPADVREILAQRDNYGIPQEEIEAGLRIYDAYYQERKSRTL